MPVNAPVEYYKAEQKYQNAKTNDEKIAALEEMVRLLPKHHGSESQHAQLRSRLAKLRKDGAKKRGTKTVGIKKEGEAQVCILGMPNAGKSTLLQRLTDARPEIGEYPYTTKKPEVGMMNYRGVKVQLVEIPATFEPRFMSIVRTADLAVFLTRNELETNQLNYIAADNFIRIKSLYVRPDEDPNKIKELIWTKLDLIVAYTKDSKAISPMALPRGSTVRNFAERIHKDFVKNFSYARLTRGKRQMTIGLSYILQDGDVVEIHTK